MHFKCITKANKTKSGEKKANKRRFEKKKLVAEVQRKPFEIDKLMLEFLFKFTSFSSIS